MVCRVFFVFKKETLTKDTVAKDSKTLPENSEEPGNVCDKNSSMVEKYFIVEEYLVR